MSRSVSRNVLPRLSTKSSFSSTKHVHHTAVVKHTADCSSERQRVQPLPHSRPRPRQSPDPAVEVTFRCSRLLWLTGWTCTCTRASFSRLFPKRCSTASLHPFWTARMRRSRFPQREQQQPKFALTAIAMKPFFVTKKDVGISRWRHGWFCGNGRAASRSLKLFVLTCASRSLTTLLPSTPP